MVLFLSYYVVVAQQRSHTPDCGHLAQQDVAIQPSRGGRYSEHNYNEVEYCQGNISFSNVLEPVVFVVSTVDTRETKRVYG